ncbi:MAG: DUF533 domain-containing protein [Paracoccaceae bacterium]
MSLVGTLAKVAVGMAVAKGVSTLAKGASGKTSGGLLGGAGGGLGEMMDDLLAGGSRSSRASTGGLGGLLEELAGAGSRNITTRSSPRGQSTGGLGEILGQLAGASGGKGGLGDLIGTLGAGGAAGGLGSLLGAALGGAGGKSGGFGTSLNAAFANGGEPDTTPDASEEAMAGLMLKAMIQAAKADGEIDAAEQAKLLERLGDISAAERAFVERELAAQVDVEGLVRAIPDGLEAQAYAMSVMAIDLDNQNEAQYLHKLASGLGLDAKSVNHIHEQIGAPALYA